MKVRVFDQQAFGHSHSIEPAISRNKGQRRQSEGRAHGVKFKRRGQLNGIIAAQRVSFGEAHRGVDDAFGDFDEFVLTAQIAAKARCGNLRISRSQGGDLNAPEQGGDQFDARDASAVERVAGRRSAQGSYPGRASLGNVAFDQRAGVEVINCH